MSIIKGIHSHVFFKLGKATVKKDKRNLKLGAFLNKYCDELYGIVDNKDRFVKNSPIDVDKLESYLSQLV